MTTTQQNQKLMGRKLGTARIRHEITRYNKKTRLDKNLIWQELGNINNWHDEK